MRVTVLGALALGGCFSPSAPAGAPCAANGDCPAPLVCSQATLTCEATDHGSALDAPVDGSPDPDGPPSDIDAPPPAGCWSRWHEPTLAITDQKPLELGITAMSLRDPALSPDELTLWFSVTMPGVSGVSLYRATRSSTAADFGQTVPATELGTPAGTARLTVRGDGREVIFASNRDGGSYDFFDATRSSTQVPWGSAARDLVKNLETTDQEFDPELVPDGLTLYFARAVVGVSQHLFIATRTGVTHEFDAAALLTLSGLTGSNLQADPAVSPDQLVLLFTSVNSSSEADIYYATRETTMQPFTVRGPVPGLAQSGRVEGDAELTADGCHVLFIAGPATNSDLIYQGVVQ